MICKNCGFECTKDDKFCPKCSFNLYNDFSSLKPYYQIEFTKIKDSDEAYKGKFNFFAFLFSWIWMVTKKMYLGALVYMIVVGILTSYVHSIFTLVFSIIIGLRGNYMYYNYYTNGTYKL